MAHRGFKPNRSGYRYVLDSSPEVRDVCQRAGDAALAQAARYQGEWSCDTQRGRVRFHTLVKADDYLARKAERDHHALSSARPRI